MKITNILKVLLFAVLLIFTSCEVQEDAVQVENKKHIHVSEKHLNELVFNRPFNESLKKLQKSGKMISTGRDAKTALEEQFNFTITNEVAKVIEAESKTSYTFAISRENQDSAYFENLVIEIDSTNQSKAFFAKYTPSEPVTVDVNNSINFKGDIDIKPVDEEEVNGESRVTTVTIIYSLCTDVGALNCGGRICGFGYMTFTSSDAVDGPSGGGGNAGGYGVEVGNNPNSNPYTYGNGGGGGYGSSPNNTNPNPNAMFGNGSTYTIPVIPLQTPNQISYAFKQTLNAAQLAWWNNVTNASSVAQIVAYLTANQVHDLDENPNDFAEEIVNSGIDLNLVNALPFFKFPLNSNYQTLFPNFTEYIKNKIPQLRNNTFIIGKLVQYSELSQSRVINDLKWGEGPTIEIVQLDDFCETCDEETYGLFLSESPNTVYVDIDIVNQIESSTNGIDGDSMAFLLGVTILHEYVHLGDFVDGIDQPGEEGILFEQDTYGESIWINNAGDVIIRRNP